MLLDVLNRAKDCKSNEEYSAKPTEKMHFHEWTSMLPLHSYPILAGLTIRQMIVNQFHALDYHLNSSTPSGCLDVADFLVFPQSSYHLNTKIAQIFWRKIHQECRKVVFEQDSGPGNKIKKPCEKFHFTHIVFFLRKSQG